MMQENGSRFILFICCTGLVLWDGISAGVVISVLFALSIACMGIYISKNYIYAVLLLLCGTAVFFTAGFCLFLPVLTYEIVNRLTKSYHDKKILNIEAVLYAVSFFMLVYSLYINFNEIGTIRVFAASAFVFISIWMGIFGFYYNMMKQRVIHIRDDSEELQMVLKSKNQYLLEKQDYEIHLATLHERNRIAREIHDNVGHLLSRSLLQTGALIAVSKEEEVKPYLEELKESLNSAMSSVRESVHDLRNDSIDVKASVKEIIHQMRSYQVQFECDISDEVEANIKYCLISIVKEAVSNILKHSDADAVNILIREQPAFFQLVVEDNGKLIRKGYHDGMGLSNIKDRIDAFNGTLSIRTEKGFRIFVSIPKRSE